MQRTGEEKMRRKGKSAVRRSKRKKEKEKTPHDDSHETFFLWLDPTETADSRRILAGSPRRHATMCWGSLQPRLRKRLLPYKYMLARKKEVVNLHYLSGKLCSVFDAIFSRYFSTSIAFISFCSST